jgi:hypothetical protein
MRIQEKIPNQIIDGLVKSRNSIVFVIPAKAGIQLFQDVLDPGFRRVKLEETFCEIIKLFMEG